MEKNTLKYLKSILPKYLDLRALKDIQSKFSKIGNLLLRDEQYRKEKVVAHSFTGLGKDVSSKDPRPWRRIPNVRNFTITLRPLDWLLQLFGIDKRSAPKLEFYAWKNAPMNRYVNYMFKRLRKQVKLGMYEEAGKTLRLLMNSVAYRTACFNSVVRNWHRKYPLWMVEDWLRELDELIATRATKIDYRRVYMEEPKKLRPLGVPTMPWRVYLHMYNNILTQWRMVTETGKQHGYLPQKGVQTAWNSLVKMMNKPNLYGADFKGFFDNVTHDGISVVLADLGLPYDEVDFVRSLNESIVQLPELVRIEEKQIDLVGQTCLDDSPDWCDLGPSEGVGSVWDEERFLRGSPSWDSIPDLKSEDGLSVVWDALIENELSEDPKYRKEVGVPQGAPTSCGLATLVLRPLETEIDILAYADDTITAPDSSDWDPEKFFNRKELGIRLKPASSEWLKKDGVWQVKSFKFLGVRYYPPEFVPLPNFFMVEWLEKKGFKLHWALAYWYRKYASLGYWRPEKFVADTRNGATLEFTRKEAFLSWLHTAREYMLLDMEYTRKGYFFNKSLATWLLHNYKKFEKIKSPSKLLWNNRLTGWFTSRMFSNSWDLRTEQDFHLTYRKDSWMAFCWPVYADENKLDYKGITVFTASSFACNDLARLIKNPVEYKEREKKNWRFVYTGPKIREDSNLSYKNWLGLYSRGYWRSIRRLEWGRFDWGGTW